MELRHPNCQDHRCKICLEDHLALEMYLREKTDSFKEDHLGKYHKWLDDNGIPNETEWGWATEETFDDENIQAYIDWYLPHRVQRKRTRGWKMPPKTVYVGRPTKWGNPFTVGCEAWRFSMNVPYPNPETISEVVEDYSYFAKLALLFDKDWLKPLRGKNLACWCPPGQRCHADVLLEMANKQRKE